ncbi:LacI family DNA-binding transcriptional regulator [Microbacterium sp. zg-Y818]|uniref:LacI family DNA-binding transcriptional regulator n=1 Tax=unclassified Microbacterium TaxID=2609290 RepID=UPI00214C126F|nr:MULTISPECIES: LacI family DNA-binding transcriptional regulator [unclassified Microbacterium]MCR2802120.1 LacI family DNA-binding transcriptional regulator [Microbacterium sp. zg.Y818]WIM22668.1 LacI family DNA-binding transcriptional regulator [Microbacterium sp. zg-Y818]
MPQSAKRTGAVRPAAMMDVARLAGVSQKTVSRVVNGEPHVSAAVQQRVLAAIDELNFRPNSAARALVSARTRTIGFVYTGSALFGPSAMSVGIERAARDAGYGVAVVHTADGTPTSVRAAFDDLIGRGVEGIVVSEPADDLRPADLPSAGIPVLSLENDPSDVGEWIMVGADDRAGAREATQHLIDLGHRSIAHIAGPRGWATSQNRLLGWQGALVAAGLAVPDVLRGDWSAASGFTAGEALAATAVTAIVAANDEMAIGAIRAMQLAGRSIPRDVSIVGIDDIPLAAYLTTPLTTVRQDFDAVAREGMSRLIDVIEGRSLTSRRYAVPTQLIVRSSTGTPVG